MPEITARLYRFDRSNDQSHWMLVDLPGPGPRPVGAAARFTSDLDVKLLAESMIRDILAVEQRLTIAAGPVWSKSKTGGYTATMTATPLQYSYRVDRLPPLHAARALVTEGGALVFLNSEGQAIKGFSPTGWASFSMENPPA